MKALLIASEDETPLLDALQGQGEIEHVGTLGEGLERLDGVDLVLLAQPLVDAKGNTPVLHLREAAPQVAILVLTATAASRSDRSLLQAGADLVLERQPGTAALRRSLGQAIERRRLLVALHRSRQGVHAIVEQSPDGIAVIKGGRVRYINPQGRAWLKWERDQIVGTPKDGAEVEADGHQLEIRATQTEWGGGPATLVLARDITRRRTSESQLRHREDRLRKAENLRSLGQLAAGLAHEFNNILTTILGHADLLGTRPENTPHSDAIRDAGERMGMLVRQMMVFSGHRHHRPVQQMLNQTLAECLQVVGQTLPESVELEVDLDPSVHQVTAVRGDLERIVISLVDNARLAAGADGTITVRTRLAGPERAILEVEDDGPGIPAELAQRVFEPFFTTRDIGEGSGLGLTAVYAMLQHAGGHIDVGRSPNLGGRAFGSCCSTSRDKPPRRSRTRAHRAEERRCCWPRTTARCGAWPGWCFSSPGSTSSRPRTASTPAPRWRGRGWTSSSPTCACPESMVWSWRLACGRGGPTSRSSSCRATPTSNCPSTTTPGFWRSPSNPRSW